MFAATCSKSLLVETIIHFLFTTLVLVIVLNQFLKHVQLFCVLASLFETRF